VHTSTAKGTAADGKVLTFKASWLLPPVPKVAPAGYTAELLRWEGPATLTGLTAKPITISNWYARSCRPEQHNFGAFFLLEPALDPTVDASALAEPQKSGVRSIFLHSNETEVKVHLLDVDGKLVEPAK